MKLKLLAFFGLMLFCSAPTFSQQIKGKIIDSKTNEPVAFATIQFSESNGVVSNMEGFFNISSDDLKSNSQLTISFMGYQTQILTVEKLNDEDNIIKLVEAVNQLNTVYVTNKLPSVDSIMARINRNLKKNYHASNVTHRLFSRQTAYFRANNLTVDIEKSSHFSKKQLESSNRQFKEFTDQIVNNPPTQTFTDVLSDLYIKTDDISKMEVLKATKLKDSKNSMSLETIQTKVTNIVLQHLDSTKSYKVKTGWFTVEDSMSLKKNKNEKKDVEDTSFKNLKAYNIKNLNEHLFQKESFMDFVLEPNNYTYQLTNVTTIDDQLVYIIAFEPRKNRAKFSGTLYVSDEDYAILKLDYSFAEGKVGEKLNLKLVLGVKTVEKVNKGTVVYKKNNEMHVYYPYYINSEAAQYVYVHRPFKFIENNDDSKNKVAFDATIEGNVVEKYELMSLNFDQLDVAAFDALIEATKTEYIQLKQYDSSIWKDYSILEPLEELKKFKVKE